MRSDNVKSGMQQAPHRSLFNALGFTEEEMKKACEKLGITQNAFVEIAIIEKLTRISQN